MAQASNSPSDRLTLVLEQRKSCAFHVMIVDSRGIAVDITGCTFSIVVADNKDVVIDRPAVIVDDPTGGVLRFNLQAADLDLEVGQYLYSVTMTSPLSYSSVLFKGEIDIQENTETISKDLTFADSYPAFSIVCQMLPTGRYTSYVFNYAALYPDAVPFTKTEREAMDDIHSALDGIEYLGDITPVGQSVITAADQTAARQAIGAGTSNLQLGTTDTTAKKGSWQPEVADVTNLQSSLDGKAPTTHTHAIADVPNLQSSLDGKAPTTHTHAIADVTNLQSLLNGKAPTTHTHMVSQISDATTVGQSLVKASDVIAAQTALGIPETRTANYKLTTAANGTLSWTADSNTIYTAMTATEATAGTSTTARTITAKVLADYVSERLGPVESALTAILGV